MEKNVESIKTNIKLPKGARVLIIIFLLKDTIPNLIISTLKLLHLEVPKFLAFICSSLSVSAGKMLLRENYPFLLATIISLLIIFLTYKVWTNNFDQNKKYRTEKWLKTFRIISIIGLLMFILTVVNGKAGYSDYELNSVINMVITFALNVAWIAYLFTNEVKEFFSAGEGAEEKKEEARD